MHPSHLALCVSIALTLAGCQAAPSGSAISKARGGAEVLHFPVTNDPKSWDPADIDAPVDTDIAQNVFDNLWRFDDRLRIVAGIATDVPSFTNGGISPDALTYTVHLRHNVTFSNGDAVS